MIRLRCGGAGAGAFVPVLLLIAAWPEAHAQDEVVLEEVVVTARKQIESLQDVSISATVMTGEKVVEAGITKVEELVPYIPNITLSETGIGTNLYVRGIGSGINQGFEQSVGMYVDGVYYGRAQLTRAPFLDLQRAEALRGPQITLLGNNSIAGALNLTTAKPGDSFEAQGSVLYEPDHGELEFTGVVSGPLTENLGARLAVRYRDFDGYLDNNLIGGEEPDREEKTARITFQYQADFWDATFKYERNEFDVNGRQIELFNPLPAADDPQVQTVSGRPDYWEPGLRYTELLNRTGADGNAFQPDPAVLNDNVDQVRGSNGDSSENDIDVGVLTLNFDVGDYQVTSVTGYLNYTYEELCDCDFTAAPVFSLESEEEFRQWSQELRVTSPQDKRFRYTAGAYFQFDDLRFTDAFLLPSDAGALRLAGIAGANNPTAAIPILGDTTVFREFSQDTDVRSFFAQFDFDITQRWRGSLGLRRTDMEKRASRALRFGDLDRNVIPITDPRTGTAAILVANVFNAAFHDISDTREENRTSWAAVTEFDFNDDTMLYASAKRGFKSGGFDVRSNSEPFDPNDLSTLSGAGTIYPAFAAPIVAGAVDPGSFEFGDEEAMAYELGAKLRLLNGAAELNVAFFHTTFEDLQISIFDGIVGFNVGNAAEATTMGLEIDGRWQINDKFRLSGAFGLLDFEFDDFPNGQCVQGQLPDDPATGDCNFAGRENQYVADWSGIVSLDYEQPVFENLLLRTTLDVNFTDEYQTAQNLDDRVVQDAYARVNLRIGLGSPDGTWEVAMLGRNLTDEEIITYSNDVPFAFSQFRAPTWYGFLERPRSFAVQAFYRY